MERWEEREGRENFIKMQISPSFVPPFLPSFLPQPTVYNFRRRRARPPSRSPQPLQSIRSFGLIVRQGDEGSFCKMSLAREASGFDATENVVSLDRGGVQ